MTSGMQSTNEGRKRLENTKKNFQELMKEIEPFINRQYAHESSPIAEWQDTTYPHKNALSNR